MSETKKKSKRVWVKILIGLAVIFLVVPFVFDLILDIHPQLLIGLFQGYQDQNSYEPRFGLTPGETVRENGIVYRNDIRYGEEYPNSFLDISYRKLTKYGVNCEFFYDTYADGTEPGHGYLSDLKNDELAQRCYSAIMEFLSEL